MCFLEVNIRVRAIRFQKLKSIGSSLQLSSLWRNFIIPHKHTEWSHLAAAMLNLPMSCYTNTELLARWESDSCSFPPWDSADLRNLILFVCAVFHIVYPEYDFLCSHFNMHKVSVPSCKCGSRWWQVHSCHSIHSIFLLVLHWKWSIVAHCIDFHG